MNIFIEVQNLIKEKIMRMLNKQDILKNLPEKNMYNKDTTSLIWKEDLIDFFQESIP